MTHQVIQRRFSAPAAMQSVRNPVEPDNDVVMVEVPAGARPGVDKLKASLGPSALDKLKEQDGEPKLKELDGEL